MLRFFVLTTSLVVLLTACAHGGGKTNSRTFRMPLAVAEAPLVLPAIGAAADKLGYESQPYGDTGMSISLADGSRFVWSAMDSFTLTIKTPKAAKGDQAPPEDVDARFRALKVKADEVWDLAIELRQKNNVGAAMVVNPMPPPPPAAQPQQQRGGFNNSFNTGNSNGSFSGSAGWNAGPQQQQPPAAGGCRSSLDCGSGGWCRDWRGQKVCMNSNGGPGSPCASGLDCGRGLFCRGDTCG